MPSIETAPSSSSKTARIIAPIGAVVAALAMLVVAAAWWAPQEMNRLALVEEQRQLANNLHTKLEKFKEDQRGCSIWDDAVRNVRIAFDEEWVIENIAVWLHDQGKHAGIFIVDHDDRPIFAYADGARADPRDAYARYAGTFADLLGNLRRAERSGPLPAGNGVNTTVARGYAARPDVPHEVRLAMVDGRPAMVGAVAFAPDFFTVHPSPGPAAVLMTIRPIDDALLAEMAHDLLMIDLAFVPPFHGEPRTSAALPLGDGASLGWLTWKPKHPGDVMQTYVLPGALAAVAAALLMALLAARHARRVTGDLLASEARARFLAHRDPLTGRPNRLMFAECLDRLLGAGKRFAVLCLDLDRFKEINDTLGHGAGDDLIRQVAQRLRGAVREGDLVARLGGDEFAVLVPNVGEAADVIGLCDRLLASFRAPFRLVGSEVSVGVSIGVALAPTDGQQRDELMRRADIALYRMKAEGRGAYGFFSPEMDESLQLRRRVETDLREVLATDGLQLAYQPLYEADGITIRGVEALARWTHPERGQIPPSFFVSVAEDSDLIHSLGEWVLRRACRDAARWAGLTMAVNLSPRQFRSPGLPRRVARILAEMDLDPRRLELEVTEGVLMDESAVAWQVLRELRAIGVRIALDDFGTGYSSLSYLRRFDFDRVKIDRSFVRALTETSEAAAIVRAVVDLGRALRMEVTAEGVETREQHQFLRDIGCDRLQGFLFSQPVPAVEIDRLMRERSRQELAPA